MAVRIKKYSINGIEQTEVTNLTWVDNTVFDNEGYGYTFGVNEVKNFLDEGRGASVAAFGSADDIVEDAIPFGTSRF